MSTQSCKATIGNNTMSRQFSITATDGVWTGNNAVDDNSSQQVGLLMPNVNINQISATYTAGCAAYRVINSATLKVSRHGFASKVPYTDYDQTAVPPYSLNQNDLMQFYPLAVDATSNQSAAMIWVIANGVPELFANSDIVDNTATAMTSAGESLSLGDAFFGKTVQSICVALEDGASLGKVEIIDQASGTQWTATGNYRGAVLGASSNYYNLEVKGMNIKIGKGWALKLTVATA